MKHSNKNKYTCKLNIKQNYKYIYNQHFFTELITVCYRNTFSHNLAKASNMALIQSKFLSQEILEHFFLLYLMYLNVSGNNYVKDIVWNDELSLVYTHSHLVEHVQVTL